MVLETNSWYLFIIIIIIIMIIVIIINFWSVMSKQR